MVGVPLALEDGESPLQPRTLPREGLVQFYEDKSFSGSTDSRNCRVCSAAVLSLVMMFA